jgi:ribosomal protein S6--L-glutamate ligase
VTESIQLDPVYEKTAIRAAQIMGLQVAGVDMLEGSKGPQVMEVNSSPGLEGLESATGLDVAGAIIDFVAEGVSFPELDVRQKLTVSKKYGVSEFDIGAKSPLLGKTIAESGLKERDIIVLSIHRDTTVISNPNPEREILKGDRLVCFGKRETMKEFLPPRKRRRRPKKLPPEVVASAEQAGAEA